MKRALAWIALGAAAIGIGGTAAAGCLMFGIAAMFVSADPGVGPKGARRPDPPRTDPPEAAVETIAAPESAEEPLATAEEPETPKRGMWAWLTGSEPALVPGVIPDPFPEIDRVKVSSVEMQRCLGLSEHFTRMHLATEDLLRLKADGVIDDVALSEAWAIVARDWKQAAASIEELPKPMRPSLQWAADSVPASPSKEIAFAAMAIASDAHSSAELNPAELNENLTFEQRETRDAKDEAERRAWEGRTSATVTMMREHIKTWPGVIGLHSLSSPRDAEEVEMLRGLAKKGFASVGAAFDRAGNPSEWKDIGRANEAITGKLIFAEIDVVSIERAESGIGMRDRPLIVAGVGEKDRKPIRCIVSGEAEDLVKDLISNGDRISVYGPLKFNLHNDMSLHLYVEPAELVIP